MGFGDEPVKCAAYTFAGLSMMLNIRLAYSSAPYALIRFKLPENLFGVFVRTIAGALELWCLPSMTLGNIMDFVRKQMKFGSSEKNTMDSIVCYSSIVCMWSDFITYVILLFVYLSGGDQGRLTAYYWVISVSGFIFGINMVLLYAMEFQYFPYYLAGENSFPAVTSIIHYLATLMFGNRRKYDSDFLIVHIDIWVAILISFTTALLWTYAYYRDKEAMDKFPSDPNQRICQILKVEPNSAPATELTYSIGQNFDDSHAGGCGRKKSYGYWLHLVPPSLMVLVGMGLIYTIYPAIAPGMTVPFYLIDKVDIVIQILTAVPPVIIKILPLIDPTLNPFVNMGTWGHYHKKQCKKGDETKPPYPECNCPAGDPTIYTTAKLKVEESGNNITKAILQLSGNSGTSATLEYTPDTRITLRDSGSVTVKFNLEQTNIAITPSSGSTDLRATATLTTTASKSISNLTNLKGDTGEDLTLSGQLSSNELTLTKNGEAITTDNNNTLKTGDTIKLEGTLTGTTIEASGTVIITNSDGTPTDQSLTLSGAAVTLKGGLTATGSLNIGGTSTTLNGDVTLAAVKYYEKEFHDKHKTTHCCYYGGKVWKWESNPLVWCWNAFDIFIPLQIILEIIFLYSLHHRDSKLSRSIINQPKMSTFLTIVYYMCHEFMLALGFSGIGSDDQVLLPMQLIGAFLMVLPAFYSKGYVIEYKRHDPNHWPTEGMTSWNAFCYWLKMSSKNTNKLLLDVFTTDLQVFFSFTHLYTPLHIYIK
ncbi:Tpr-related protein family member, putative [Theileria annulata]|uniref:Tpr-related protein family member, putative n=1 Tax=Theileria annulata TaxID=5874 RepID=Q4UIL2_THEAN|nr:Tpr-related protein family member, putative [Theileria annulata]CAI73077.1 Tpr-related protein family member, putative [Theileria annulata]|eukprot:XP_953755.1 Tpr-related protein family member, putative [Theileria annulata]